MSKGKETLKRLGMEEEFKHWVDTRKTTLTVGDRVVMFDVPEKDDDLRNERATVLHIELPYVRVDFDNPSLRHRGGGWYINRFRRI